MNDLVDILIKFKYDKISLEEAKEKIFSYLNIEKLNTIDKDTVYKDLEIFFNNTEVGGFKIKEFKLVISSFDENSMFIIPIIPYIDECYEDKDSDALIKSIGKANGLNNLSFIPWFYTK